MVHSVKQRAWGTAAEIAATVIESREVVFNVDDSTLHLGNGSDLGGAKTQKYGANLDALRFVTSAADKLPYFTGSGTAAVADFTTAGRALVDDATAAAQRVTLGLNAYTASTPTTGGTVTAAAGERRRILKHTTTLATLTVVLPSSPVDGDPFELLAWGAITALTVSGAGGATVRGGSFLMPADTGASWVYSSGDTTWSRRY